MKEGDRIYYTGDMANMPSAGTITKIRPPDKWGPESYDIKFDEERFDGDALETRGIYKSAFTPGPGRRFMLLEEYTADRERRIEEMQRRYQTLKSRKSS